MRTNGLPITNSPNLASFWQKLTGLGILLLGLSLAARAAQAPALKEVFKDDFMMGTAINRMVATGKASGWRTQEQVDRDVVQVLGHFNQVTAENDHKWALIHPREGADGYDFTGADALVDFGTRHGMVVVGHTLVWHSQTPNWVFAGEQSAPAVDAARGPRRPGGGAGRWDYDGPRATREQLLERMRDHIHTVVGRYKGRIWAWDVVNEALSDSGTEVLRDSLWHQIIGPDYIAKAFEFAHEADPEAVLRYNDYGLENPAKRRKLSVLIQSLQEKGVPVMAIGTQAHLNVTSAGFEGMDAALSDMEKLGLPIHVTELDINSAQGGQRNTNADVADNGAATQGGLVSEADRQLAAAYEGVFRAFLKHKDSIEMVTFWGPNDANSWRRNGSPLLFNTEGQPKPAFDAVIRLR
ncbi:MAG: endo-1,4-beta-xylanase [Limisphaerales bacterium]